MKTEFKLEGVDGVLDTLRALPRELVSKRGGPVRTALRKGAVVIHKQVVANLQAATANASSEEQRLSTGHLARNVVVTRGKPPFDGKGERYLVRIKRKPYPDREGVSTLKTAQLLEYGSSQQPAEPYIRPAFSSRAQEAINTATKELAAAVDRIARKHLKNPR